MLLTGFGLVTVFAIIKQNPGQICSCYISICKLYYILTDGDDDDGGTRVSGKDFVNGTASSCSDWEIWNEVYCQDGFCMIVQVQKHVYMCVYV